MSCDLSKSKLAEADTETVVSAASPPKNPLPKRPTASSRALAYFFLFGFLAFLSVQVLLVQKAVKRSDELSKSYISYSELDVDKDEYAPGDVVGFTYTRYARKGDGYPLLYLTIDSFENLDTGEVFTGVTAARIIKASGIETRHGLRELPDYATPGRYRIEGWSSSQTDRLTSATGYTSEVFIVKQKQ